MKGKSGIIMGFLFFNFGLSTMAQLFNIQREKETAEPSECTTEAITKAMKQYYKDYGEAELARCEKWHVNKSKSDVLKIFNGYAFKKGFFENKEIYIGPLFYGRRPNGIQDVYNCYLYDGLGNSRMGTTMAFANAYVFYKFWLDTAKHHIIPLSWNTPAAYIPPSFLVEKQGSADDWKKRFQESCQNPNDPVMKQIYVMYFLYWQDYYTARSKMKADAKSEVNDYKIKSFADAAYYDFYYGPNGKTEIKWNEEVIRASAENWAIDSLNTFIRHYPYSKHFNTYAARFIEAQTSIGEIITALREFPGVTYNKQKVETTLLSLCKSIREIGLLRSLPDFTQLKQIEAKAFSFAKTEKTIEAYETFLSYYTAGANSIEIKKLRDAELKRIEDERLSRLKTEGPGGIWHLYGPELGTYLWVNTYRWKVEYLDKTTGTFYCEFFPQITSVSVSNEKIFEKVPNQPKTYFRIDNWFYLYQNITYAAKAWYKMSQNKGIIENEGLIEARDETPVPKKDESDIYQISAKTESDCYVIYSSLHSHIAAIEIEDGGMTSSNVIDDQYYSTVYDKNEKQIFKTNNPFEDNGMSGPNISSYDLPATVVVNYKRSKSDKLKTVVVKILKPGKYTIRIN